VDLLERVAILGRPRSSTGEIGRGVKKKKKEKLIQPVGAATFSPETKSVCVVYQGKMRTSSTVQHERKETIDSDFGKKRVC